MNVVESLRSITTKLSRATVSVTDEIQQIRTHITEARAAIQAVERASVSRAELEARARTQVEADGKAWLRAHGASLGVFARRARPKPGYAPGLPRHHQTGISELSTWGALCARDPQTAVAQFLALCECAGVEYGPDAAEHTALAARLRRELAELEAADERLVDDAAAAGLVIEHRREVLQRRQDEAIERARAEEKIADRRARQAALDRRHAEQTRGARSRYLAPARERPIA